MDSSHYFLLPDGRLRAGWRLFLFIALFFVAENVAVWLFAPLRAVSFLAAEVLVLAGAAIPATWLMTHFVEQQPFDSIGLRPSGAGKQGADGLAMGAILAGSVILVDWGARLIAFERVASRHPGTWSGVYLSTTVLILLSATTEEILFRGYPFQCLVEGIGAWPATLIASALFGLGHASNPYASKLSIANTALAGMLLSLAYLRTRGLWFPIAVHFAWNWLLALAGLPVSGLQLLRMPWTTAAAANYAWLNGGDYGPEAGLIATAALAAGVLYLAIRPAARLRESS